MCPHPPQIPPRRLPAARSPWFRQNLLQRFAPGPALIPLALIALFSSYDHITFAGRSIRLQQQWGIPFIFIPTNRARLQFLLTLLDQTSVQHPEV